MESVCSPVDGCRLHVIRVAGTTTTTTLRGVGIARPALCDPSLTLYLSLTLPAVPAGRGDCALRRLSSRDTRRRAVSILESPPQPALPTPARNIDALTVQRCVIQTLQSRPMHDSGSSCRLELCLPFLQAWAQPQGGRNRRARFCAERSLNRRLWINKQLIGTSWTDMRVHKLLATLTALLSPSITRPTSHRHSISRYRIPRPHI